MPTTETTPRKEKAIGYNQLATLATSIGLAPVPPGARWARIVPEAQAVRWRDDSGTPLASLGMPLAVGETLDYYGDLSAILFIEQTAGAKLNITFYG